MGVLLFWLMLNTMCWAVGAFAGMVYFGVTDPKRHGKLTWRFFSAVSITFNTGLIAYCIATMFGLVTFHGWIICSALLAGVICIVMTFVRRDLSPKLVQR